MYQRVLDTQEEIENQVMCVATLPATNLFCQTKSVEAQVLVKLDENNS